MQDAAIEAVAEYLYGHTRQEAIGWGKGDKFDSCHFRATEIANIVNGYMAASSNPTTQPPEGR